MDKIYFNQCVSQVLQGNKIGDSIGTYKEKTLHKVLKLYFERDKAFHEVRVGGYVADILNSNGIVEVQTGGFSSMEKKLSKLLSENRVRLVFPICSEKYVAWVDPETGEVSKRRKSPKKGRVCHVLPEIYKIKRLIHNENLTIDVVMINAVDYRYLNGWGKDKKRGSRRMERIPKDLSAEYEIKSFEDYIELVPDELPCGFCSNDFAKVTGLSLGKARSALLVLTEVKAVERIGKKGNKILYKKNR